MNSSPLLVVVVLAVLVLAVYPSTSSSPSNNGTGSPYTPTTPWSTSIPWPTSTAIVAGSTTTPPTSSQWDDRFTGRVLPMPRQRWNLCPLLSERLLTEEQLAEELLAVPLIGLMWQQLPSNCGVNRGPCSPRGRTLNTDHDTH